MDKYKPYLFGFASALIICLILFSVSINLYGFPHIVLALIGLYFTAKLFSSKRIIWKAISTLLFLIHLYFLLFGIFGFMILTGYYFN
ncbi:hypothetical protein CEF21_04975 [Bacillus sp. FJAT-42376]|nr:hypothetical protein CEF21_04975 [Bacillus sp. FJAT-42376]